MFNSKTIKNQEVVISLFKKSVALIGAITLSFGLDFNPLKAAEDNIPSEPDKTEEPTKAEKAESRYQSFKSKLNQFCKTPTGQATPACSSLQNPIANGVSIGVKTAFATGIVASLLNPPQKSQSQNQDVLIAIGYLNSKTVQESQPIIPEEEFMVQGFSVGPTHWAGSSVPQSAQNEAAAFLLMRAFQHNQEKQKIKQQKQLPVRLALGYLGWTLADNLVSRGLKKYYGEDDKTKSNAYRFTPSFGANVDQKGKIQEFQVAFTTQF